MTKGAKEKYDEWLKNEKIKTETWGKIPWKHTSTSSRNDERGYNLFNSKQL